MSSYGSVTKSPALFQTWLMKKTEHKYIHLSDFQPEYMVVKDSKAGAVFMGFTLSAPKLFYRFCEPQAKNLWELLELSNLSVVSLFTVPFAAVASSSLLFK